MLNRRLDLWLPSYLAGAPLRWYRRHKRTTQHTHVIFLICDHFEPRHGIHHVEQAAGRINAWQSGYAEFQQKCRDEFGTAPLHTWFYPPHHGSEHLAGLAAMAHAGLGEVELHYHHENDTHETLTRDLQSTLDEYNRWGLLLASGDQPSPSFGFIHGDWALGNAAGGQHCGVNDELTVLKKLGCWADLTMPSADRSQTRKINAIYYGKSNPYRAKAHSTGPNAAVGKTADDGLMLIQGPLGINWHAPSYPRIENASLTSANWGRSDRIRKWIDCHVHVRGRPEWLFIKLHAHGAIEKDFDALFGEKAMAMHRELHQKYNDGKRYTLHYVTARQAYNIAKAAEDGHSGNPSDYLDYRIAVPATALYAVDARHVSVHCSPERLKLNEINSNVPVRIQTRVGPITMLRGAISALEIDTDKHRIFIDATGTVDLQIPSHIEIEIVSGATEISNCDGNLRVEISQRCVLRYR